MESSLRKYLLNLRNFSSIGWVEHISEHFKKGWRGDCHIRFNTTIVGGGSHRLACGMCVYLYVCLYCLCVCTLISVDLIGCVLEQVSQVDAASLCRALWAPSELLLDGHGGCQLLWEGDEGQGGGIWRVSCLWKIWSAQVCLRYC